MDKYEYLLKKNFEEYNKKIQIKWMNDFFNYENKKN